MNNKLQGAYTEYYPDGKPKVVGYFKDSLRHGLFRFYTPKGEIAEEILYYEGFNRDQKVYYERIPGSRSEYRLVSKPGIMVVKDGVRISEIGETDNDQPEADPYQ